MKFFLTREPRSLAEIQLPLVFRGKPNGILESADSHQSGECFREMLVDR